MNPEQWLSLKWNGGSTMSDRWLNQSKIIQEIEEMPLNKLYSYDTFLKMDILKKIIKPKNFSLILLEEVSDNFWNWEL